MRFVVSGLILRALRANAAGVLVFLSRYLAGSLATAPASDQCMLPIEVLIMYQLSDLR